MDECTCDEDCEHGRSCGCSVHAPLPARMCSHADWCPYRVENTRLGGGPYRTSIDPTLCTCKVTSDNLVKER